MNSKIEDRANLKAAVETVAETLREIAKAIETGQETYRPADDFGNEYPVDDFPLEVIAEIGRPWTVVISTGGPHIAITADGYGAETLVGYWGRETVKTMGRGQLGTVLDYYTGRDS